MTRPANHAPAPATDAPRRTLVTGGAGFIGSHLVEHLLARGDRVTVIDDLSTGREGNLAAARASSALTFVRATVTDAIRRGEAEGPWDEVYHLAAAVGVRRIIERPVESIETNIVETAALLRALAGAGRRPGALPRVLIASSSEVYGKSARSPFREEDDRVYGPTTASRWSYACSKAIDEHLALAHHAQGGLPVVVGRFFNIIGPRQVGDYGMVVPRFVRAALADESPTVYGDGLQTRCFCDVRDVVPALPRLLGAPGAPGRVFNIGSDEPISMLALAERVVRVLGRGKPPRLIPYDAAYAPGFEDLRQRRPDLGRLRAAIGFTPTITLDQSIRDIAAEIAGESGPSINVAGQTAPARATSA